MPRSLRLAQLVFLLALAGCGLGSPTPDSGADPVDAGSQPASDAGQDVDAGQAVDAGVALVGPFTVTSAFEKTTITRTNNALAITVKDANGVAVVHANVTVDLWMPSMGHGATSPRVVEVGDGGYRAASVNFSMPGRWEVTTIASLDGLSGEQKINAVSP